LARRDVFIWAVAILFLNQMIAVVKEFPVASLEALFTDLGTVGIFQYMAWYAVLRLLVASDRITVARPQHVVIIAALCLLMFVPTSRMVWIAASGVAIYMWFSGALDAKLRAAGIVLAALSVQELWGRVLFSLIELPLLRAEAAIVGTTMSAAQPGTVWHDNFIMGPSGHGIVIIGPCSSFHNVSLAMLCWVTVSKLSHQNWRVRDFVTGGVIGITMILLNLARLFLMAWDRNLHEYWHGGPGSEIFAIGASLTILLISLYGARPLGRLTR
jgi:hypothetical protein